MRAQSAHKALEDRRLWSLCHGRVVRQCKSSLELHNVVVNPIAAIGRRVDWECWIADWICGRGQNQVRLKAGLEVTATAAACE